MVSTITFLFPISIWNKEHITYGSDKKADPFVRETVNKNDLFY